MRGRAALGDLQIGRNEKSTCASVDNLAPHGRVIFRQLDDPRLQRYRPAVVIEIREYLVGLRRDVGAFRRDCGRGCRREKRSGQKDSLQHQP